LCTITEKTDRLMTYILHIEVKTPLIKIINIDVTHIVFYQTNVQCLKVLLCDLPNLRFVHNLPTTVRRVVVKKCPKYGSVAHELFKNNNELRHLTVI
jgi:hypothetical protein